MGAQPRLGAVVLEVADLDRSVEMYRDAFGLDFVLVPTAPSTCVQGDRWTSARHAVAAGLGSGGPALILYESRDVPTSRLRLELQVEDLPHAHRRALGAGARIAHGPRAEAPGRCARYFDPDGNLVELTEVIDLTEGVPSGASSTGVAVS